MTDQNSSPEFDIHRVIRVLRRRKLVIIVLTAVVPLAALAYSLRQPPQYSATATVLLQNPQLPQQVSGSLLLAPAEDPTRVAATDVQLIQLGAVANKTEALLHRAIGSVSVSGNASTDLVQITATEGQPAFAATVANAYAKEYEEFSRQQEAATILSVRSQFVDQYGRLSVAARNGAQGRALLSTVNKLERLAALQTGNAALVQAASTPTVPSGPQTKRNVVLGLAAGLLLGLALAFLIDVFDRRVREPSELEEIFQRPILATVPELRELKSDGTQTRSLPGQVSEAFQLLRANLRYFNVDRDLKVVLVTSALPGEGKTTVAWNLAAAAARANTRVLLIEADLRRPSLALRLGLLSGRWQRRSGIPSVSGLSTLLSGQEPLEHAVEHTSVGRQKFSNGDGGRFVDVLFAGPKPPNPTDLIESERMANLIKESKERYDVVVVDTPPAALVSDAVPLVRHVDGVIVVSRLRMVTRESATHLQKQLERLHAPFIGVVVNALRKADAYGYGSYYYARGYYSGLAEPLEPLNGSDGLRREGVPSVEEERT